MIRPLDPDDLGYALYSWRESYKKAPGVDRMPWAFYKDVIVPVFDRILKDASTTVLGAYSDTGDLLGWLAMTPSKRVHTVHWCYVKHKLDDGQHIRRHGVMSALLDRADIGARFVYTLHARRDKAALPDGTATKSLDESLVYTMRTRGVSATYIPMREWLK